MAEHYLAQGHRVVGCSRQQADIRSARYQHFRLDVSDEPAVKKMFEAIRGRHKGLDVLINNAGIAAMNSVLLTPLSQLREIAATNLLGPFLFCRESARLMMRQKSGRIINMTSVAVPLKLEGEAAYAASKAAVIAMTQVMAREFADFGITVNAVGPTPIQTDLIRGVPKEKIAALVARQAIRRLGRFEDVSNVTDFLIRPESAFVTGQVIFLGGC